VGQKENGKMLKIVLIGLSGIGTFIFFTDSLVSEKKSVEFISRVSLETNCEIESDSFGVQNTRTGQTSGFKYGEAFIRARTTDELQIVMAPEYSGVTLQGVKYPATLRVEAFQDCNKRVSLDAIFESMNEQFRVKN
jgi:hypothetical protein